ncbi:MAG: AAA family ATPase [Candidatus Undinarchaeales archaeon]
MITKAKLKNWRSHLDSEFKFSGGVNTLLGIMGSGKSSVLDGICFALFGTFPALNQRKVKIDEIIRNKPNQAKEASVEVEFLRDQEVYSVKREIKYGKGTSGAEIRKNGDLLEAENSQAVTEYVSKILQTKYDVFSRAIYSEQNNIDEFLTMPKGRRMEKIDNLLQIDKFESARKKVTTVANKIGQELESKKEMSEEILTEEDRQAIKDLEKETEKLKKDTDSLSKKLSELKEKKEKLSDDVEKLNEAEKNLKEFQSKKDSIKGKISQIKETLEEYGKVELSKEEAEKKLEKIKKEIEKLEETLEIVSELKEKLASLKSRKEVLKENVEKIESKINSYGFDENIEEIENLTVSGVSELLEKEQEAGKQSPEEKVESLKNKITKKERKLEALLTKQEYSRHIISELETGDLCPTCKSELRVRKKEDIILENKKDIEKIENRKKELKEELNQIQEELKKLEEEAEKEKEKEAELKTKANLILEKAKSRTEKIKERKELAEKIEKLKKEIEEKTPKKDKKEFMEKLEKFKKISEYYSLKDKIKKLKEELEEIKTKIEKKEEIVDKLKEKEKEFNKLTAKEEGLSSDLKGLKNLYSEKEKRLKELKEKEELLKKTKKKIEKLKEKKNQLKIFKTALKSTQESLREEFVKNANTVMSEIWGTLYPYQDLDSLKLMIEDRDYVLKVHTANGWSEVEGIASGGERTLAALALRIAFSFALAPNLSWLILDEPTHNLDTNSIEELSEVLREQLPEIINQIFLITHEQRLESAVSGYLYKLKRNKERDEPTRVELVSEPGS